MKKLFAVLTVAVLAFALTACGAPQEEVPEEQVEYEIALVTDSGMIMDGGYSEVAWTAITEFGASNGVSHKYYKAAEATEEAYMSAIDNAAAKGAKVVIADGYSFEDVVYDAQKKYEDISFVLIDAEPEDTKSGKTKIAENTMSVLFASEQAGYLAGYSAVKDGYSEFGFMGAAEHPVIMDYGYGFLQGADAAARTTGKVVNVRYHYFTAKDDREAVADLASKWYEEGTEVIFACGAGIEQPVIEAAEIADGKVIACETDKSEMSDTVLTSAVKDIAGVLNDILERYEDEEFPGGTEEFYNAQNEGINLEIENARFAAFDEDMLEDVYSMLADGEIEVKKSSSGAIASLPLARVAVTIE